MASRWGTGPEWRGRPPRIQAAADPRDAFWHSFSFEALGEMVSLCFGNAQTVQIWCVPKEQSQAMFDRIGADSNFDVQASARVSAVQPQGNEGGTITVNVAEYELSSRRGRRVIAKVKVDDQRYGEKQG